MSYDYAKRRSDNNRNTSNKRPNSVSRKPPAKPSNTSRRAFHLRSFIIGIAVTLCVQMAYHWAKQSPKVEQAVIQAKQAILPTTDKTKKPEITFYQTLPDMKVKVDTKPVPETSPVAYNYVLQAGSFRNANEANQQRAEVMLLGLDATIETTVNTSGNTWHRVIVGPFRSRSQLNSARSKLADNNMPTLTLKR